MSGWSKNPFFFSGMDEEMVQGSITDALNSSDIRELHVVLGPNKNAFLQTDSLLFQGEANPQIKGIKVVRERFGQFILFKRDENRLGFQDIVPLDCLLFSPSLYVCFDLPEILAFRAAKGQAVMLIELQ